MQFQRGDNLVQWHGIQAGQLLFMSKKQASKLDFFEGKRAYALLLTGNSKSSIHSLHITKEIQKTLPQDLQ